MGSFFQTLVRIVLIVINFIVLVSGLLLAGSGIYAYVTYKDVEIAQHFYLETSTTASITLGCIIIVISFSGFWGAIRKSQCLLITFACFMFLFLAAYGFCLYVVMTGFGDFNYHQLKHKLHNSFVTTFSKENNYELFIVEDLLHCCGKYGIHSYGIKYGLFEVPSTCCTEKHTTMNSYYEALSRLSENVDSQSMKTLDSANLCLKINAHRDGCLDALATFLDAIKNYITKIIIGKLVLVGLEFIGAVYLSSATSSQQKRDRRSHY